MNSKLHQRRAFFLMAFFFAILATSRTAIAQIDTPPARQFDVFIGEHLGSCDFGARLDNLAIEISNNQTADAFIVAYGPQGSGSGSGNHWLEIISDYFLNTRGIDASRIKTMYGGQYETLGEIFIELWVLPRGADQPKTKTFENSARSFSGKFAEYIHWEGPSEGEGIPRGNTRLAGFADVLHQQPESRGYVVAENLAGVAPGAWRRAANELTSSLEGEYGIPADRIKVIYAGSDQNKKDDAGSVNLQLWVLPKNAKPPVAEATEPEPIPKEAVLWRSFSVWDLDNDSEKDDIRASIADILRSSKELNVCIVARPKGEEIERQELDAASAAVVKDDASDAAQEQSVVFKVPEIDLMRVVGEWQSDLSNDLQIKGQQVTVVMAIDEESYGRLDVWVVPRGAPLPDPNKNDNEEFNEEEIPDGMTENEVVDNPLPEAPTANDIP